MIPELRQDAVFGLGDRREREVIKTKTHRVRYGMLWHIHYVCFVEHENNLAADWRELGKTPNWEMGIDGNMCRACSIPTKRNMYDTHTTKPNQTHTK